MRKFLIGLASFLVGCQLNAATMFEQLRDETVVIENDSQKESDRWLCAGVEINAERGEILTARHCVVDAEKLLVTIIDGKRYYAKVLKIAIEDDLALIQIDAKLKYQVRLGKPYLGQDVWAMGHPKRHMWTLSKGIISRIFDNLTVTDTYINHGSSGGPLVDKEGRLVGINVLTDEGLAAAVSVPAIKEFLKE